MKFLMGPEAMKMVKSLEKVFKGVPNLPKGLVDFLVSVAPWLAGLGALTSLYAGSTSLFFSGRRSAAFSYIGSLTGLNPTYFMIAGVISILTGLLMLMAFTPLKNRKLDGWMYMFWVSLLNIAQSIVGMVMGYGGLVGTLIGAAIGFYVLFEMKPRYKS